jgi:ribonuclease III
MLRKYVRRFYNYFLSRDKKFARSLNNVLGFTPANLDIFKLAFFHKSGSISKDFPQNNERLEYLGDAILSSVVASYLYRKYPYQHEGFLTKMRSKIVKRETLNSIGDQMGIDILLREFNDVRMSRSMMGNALEALIGAIYLDFGYLWTEQFIIKKVLRKYLDVHGLEQFDDNYKSKLLEYCQKYGKDVEYKVLEKALVDKRDHFKISVNIDGKPMAYGEDFNKKSAEQMASAKALLVISQDDNFIDDEAFF